jgi:1-acyl-sn-glycerol-3-phosphate acyltransferase
MHKTMYTTFLVKDLLWLLSKLFLWLSCWKVTGQLPQDKKFVMIAAPHTSNWDLPFMLMVSFALKAKPYWMGKEQIFKLPFKGLMKWMGGIPIDRNKSNNVVEYTVELIKQSNELIVTVPPEGTRSKVKYWKTGFYHIALLAEVPIVLGFLDYEKKTGGIGGLIYPSGDIEKDMLKIKAFYRTVSGKNCSRYEE